MVFFFFKQKTAYEMRISDWSSDVCSSDLFRRRGCSLFASDNHRDSFGRCMDPLSKMVTGNAGRRTAAKETIANASPERAMARRARRSEERRVGKERVRTGRTRWEAEQ